MARERAAATEMVRAYGEGWKRIREQVSGLTQRMADAKTAGETVDTAWLLQQDRLAIVQRQVEAEIRQLAAFAEERIVREQLHAIDSAQREAEQLILAGLGERPPDFWVTFARVPTQALANMVGFLGDGSPLRELLDTLGPEASAGVRRELIAGIAAGQGPAEIARRVRKTVGMSLTRALRISRTETLRCYREAAHQTYRANRDVLRGWIWHSALGTRTCVACWAMHGTEHDVDERLDDHINGRCAAIPLTKGWAELGFEGLPETRVSVPLGTALFDQLPADQQEKILGKAALGEYREGRVTLGDFVQRTTSARWGTMRSARSLTSALRKTDAS